MISCGYQYALSILGVLDPDCFEGCSRGPHTASEAKPVPPLAPAQNSVVDVGSEPQEAVKGSPQATDSETKESAPAAERMAPMASIPAPVVEEEEDMSATVPVGTKCRHNGCSVTFSSDKENRVGDAPGTKCIYHPGLVRGDSTHSIVRLISLS